MKNEIRKRERERELETKSESLPSSSVLQRLQAESRGERTKESRGERKNRGRERYCY